MRTYSTVEDAVKAIEARDTKIAALTTQLQGLLALQGKTAGFIEQAHAGLAAAHDTATKLAKFNADFREQAAKLAGLLESRALISPSRTGELVDKLASNPMAVFDVCINIANQVPAADVGEAAGVAKQAAYEELDGFDKLAVDANPGLKALFAPKDPNLLEQSGR